MDSSENGMAVFYRRFPLLRKLRSLLGQIEGPRFQPRAATALAWTVARVRAMMNEMDRLTREQIEQALQRLDVVLGEQCATRRRSWRTRCRFPPIGSTTP